MVKDGEKYGKLTVIRFDQIRCKIKYWFCKCDCGVEKSVSEVNLFYKSVVSCGCYRRQLAKVRNSTHGLSRTKEYNAWYQMIDRCTNVKNKQYQHYGGRGISVYEPWIKSFEVFLNDMGFAPSSSHSLDRKNNDDNYSPENCRWANDYDQRRNKQQTVWIGDKTMKEWSNSLGIPYKRVHALYRYKGMTFDQIESYYKTQSKE